MIKFLLTCSEALCLIERFVALMFVPFVAGSLLSHYGTSRININININV